MTYILYASLYFVFITAAIPALLFVLPMGAICNKGLVAARDPQIRLTPQSAWESFDRFTRSPARRWLRIWLLLLCLYMVYVLAYLWSVSAPGSSDRSQLILLSAFGRLVSILTIWTLASLATLYWAPRCRSAAALMILSLSTTFVSQAVLSMGPLFALYFVMPATGMTSWIIGLNLVVAGLLGSSVGLLIALALTGLYWRRIRRNDAWFRFDSLE